MDHDLLVSTTKASIWIQLLSGIVGLYGVFIVLPSKDRILTDILILETVVQLIEFVFYAWLVMNLSKTTYDITFTRYYDWFLSTPLMLVSTVLFMKYNSSPTLIRSIDVLKQYGNQIATFILANAGMLLFGVLGEMNTIPRWIGLLGGSLAFLYSFYIIYSHFVDENQINQMLFYFMFFIWALYGVAYMLPYYLKNCSYNILDILAKNFYGLFILYFVLEKWGFPIV
jgi:bacteriorhodopsin